MKLKLTIVLSVLFVMVPVATPKGASQGLTFSVQCDAADSCVVTASGLGANASYQLEVSDSCGAQVYTNAVNASSTGTLNHTLVPAESPGCHVTGWTFSLFTIGRRPSQVATFVASDPN